MKSIVRCRTGVATWHLHSHVHLHKTFGPASFSMHSFIELPKVGNWDMRRTIFKLPGQGFAFIVIIATIIIIRERNKSALDRVQF